MTFLNLKIYNLIKLIMLNFAQKMALSNKLSNKTNKNFTKKY